MPLIGRAPSFGASNAEKADVQQAHFGQKIQHFVPLSRHL